MSMHSELSAEWQSMCDRHRNAWLAEHAMGWKLLDRRVMGWGDGPDVFSTGEDPDDPDSSPTFQGPQFTTDVAHDLRLLQKLTADVEAGTQTSEFWGEFCYALFVIGVSNPPRIGPDRGYEVAARYQPGAWSTAYRLAWEWQQAKGESE